MTRVQLTLAVIAAAIVGSVTTARLMSVDQAPFVASAQDPMSEDAGSDVVVDTDVRGTEEALPTEYEEQEGGRLICRVFETDVRSPTTLDTSDGTTEVGQWVQEQLGDGLALYSVDFEVGQKPTGYPQGYVQVCVYPG